MRSVNSARVNPGYVVKTVLIALLMIPFPVSAQEAASPETSDVERFITHLRANFEDIHEVSMRFHMTDPSLGGLIVLQMEWNEGRMTNGSVLENETGSKEEGAALLEAIGKWRIDGIEGPSSLQIPFRIKLVGSDDPAFPQSGILTGSVKNASGTPIHRAQIRFISSDDAETTLDPARTNREGVFIRTLVRPGTWDLECSAEGFETAIIPAVEFEAGTHHVRHFTLQPVSQSPSPPR
ncbi:MAG: carboxypeptidase regulatory-like domain-containing protein [Acidobacteriota bacterium]|nr:MAG: carboxypeptidase regulatory-like domain-containing protein [Acidobacteriota bacterium]